MNIKFKHEFKHNDHIGEKKLIDILLKNRKIKDKQEFLVPTHPSKINLADFGFKREINKTLKLLKSLKEANKMIIVYTDYDADGITGGAILWETLHLLGFKVMPYVPHRQHEGYGFSVKGIDNVKKLYNPALIISVDHGITAREKVGYAKKLGISVIITDHHLKPEKLPIDAEAIFHIPELSGSGVAYFFAKEIFTNYQSTINNSLISNFQLLTSNFNSDYLALASIGTIADLVPLLGPSRSIVKYGLEAFPKVKRVGIKHILEQAGIAGKKITPYEIGFIIAPRINAVGRLEHAIDALRLLCTKKEDKAYELAHRVGDKNRQRQDLVEQAVKEAQKMITNNQFPFTKPAAKPKNQLPKIIILFSEKWHEGIIGLIASKICEEFYRPAIVLTSSDGFLKGSARSIPALHITKFLRSLKKHLIDVGGHSAAAGFTMEKKELTTFATIVAKVANKQIKDKDLVKTIEADAKIPLSLLDLDLAKTIEELAPFGIGNPKPVFYSSAEIIDIKIFGRDNNHFKIYASDGNSSYPLELIAFFQAEKYLHITSHQKVNLVYTLDIDRWGGKEKLRGKIVQLSS